MQLWMCVCISNHSGGNGKRDPPVLIPNTEVKPLRAECTWLDTARETMAPPDITSSLSSPYKGSTNARLAQSVEHAAVNRSVVGSSPTTSANSKKSTFCINLQDADFFYILLYSI